MNYGICQTLFLSPWEPWKFLFPMLVGSGGGYPKVSPFKVEPSILTVTNQSTAIAPVANGLNRETLEGIDFCQREEDHLGSCTGPLARDCSEKFAERTERRTCQILGFTATNPDAPNCSVQVSSQRSPNSLTTHQETRPRENTSALSAWDIWAVLVSTWDSSFSWELLAFEGCWDPGFQSIRMGIITVAPISRGFAWTYPFCNLTSSRHPVLFFVNKDKTHQKRIHGLPGARLVFD